MSSENRQVKYFGWLITIVGFILLVVVWGLIKPKGFWCGQTWIDLVVDIIPNLLGPLLTFFILYFLFIRKGINLERILTNEVKWLAGGYEDFEQIPWEPHLQSSTRIVIAAFFFEEWISNHSNQVSQFISREGSRLIIYLPNYHDTELINQIHTIIPEHSPEELTKKIKDSINEVKKRCVNKTQDVTVSLYKSMFYYTFQLFDKQLFLSVNELKRGKDFKSPFIKFDLAYSKVLDKFYRRETEVLEANSERIDLLKWTY